MTGQQGRPALLPIDLTVGMIGATVKIDQPEPGGKRLYGSGFLVDDPRPDGTPRTVLITAGHVFDQMTGPTVLIGYRRQGPDGAWKYSGEALAIRQGAAQLWVEDKE